MSQAGSQRSASWRPGRSVPPRVLIISGSVGAGHDGAAEALATRLRASGMRVDRRDFLDALPGPVRATLRGCYAAIVTFAPWAFGWAFTNVERGGAMHRLSMALCALAKRRVAQWLQAEYQGVVSTYPFASQTVGQLRASGQMQCPAVTFLTDPAVHRLWVHPGVDHHLTVTQATADQGAGDYQTVMQVGGPLVGAAFRRAPDSTAALRARSSIRAELDISQQTAVALILTGSLGMGDVVATVEAVVAGGAAVPIVACGRNERLRRSLAPQLGVRALGWREDVADLMMAADVLITNAGGLSFTEALVIGLPAVCFAPIPGHGRANAQVLNASGLAPWARTTAELTEALKAATRPGHRHRLVPAPDCRVDKFVAELATGQPGDQSQPRRATRRRRRAAA